MTCCTRSHEIHHFVSDTAIFMLKRDVKRQPTNRNTPLRGTYIIHVNSKNVEVGITRFLVDHVLTNLHIDISNIQRRNKV